MNSIIVGNAYHLGTRLKEVSWNGRTYGLAILNKMRLDIDVSFSWFGIILCLSAILSAHGTVEARNKLDLGRSQESGRGLNINGRRSTHGDKPCAVKQGMRDEIFHNIDVIHS